MVQVGMNASREKAGFTAKPFNVKQTVYFLKCALRYAARKPAAQRKRRLFQPTHPFGSHALAFRVG
jgi:hypothetical protein